MNKNIKDVINKDRFSFDDLRVIFAYLRGENGCPWDRVQTHESIRANLIEETYEVVEAIDNKDSLLMREELGDLLLQVVFHAAIEEEEGRYTLDDVISDVADKLVRRHPHVFGDTSADDADSAIDAWEKAKGVEKADRKTTVDSMVAVPPALPALMRAEKVVKKAVKGGFDGKGLANDGSRKLYEVAKAMEDGDELSAETVSDGLFALAAYAQLSSLDLEELLHKKTVNFIKTYKKL